MAKFSPRAGFPGRVDARSAAVVGCTHSIPPALVMLRLGIVGGGVAVQMARPVLAALDYVCLTYLPDTPERFPEFDFVEDLDVLLSSREVDAIYIATPVAMHIPIARKVLAAGLPALIEKPLARSPHEGENGLSGVDIRGVALAFRNRYSDLASSISAARTATAAHCELRITWLAPHPGSNHWKALARRDGGGVCLDLGSHVFDLIEHCVAPIDDVLVEDYLLNDSTGSDECVQFRLLLRDGSSVVTHLGWAVAEPVHSVEYSDGCTTIHWSKQATSTSSALSVKRDGFTDSTVCFRSDEYARMFGDFARFVRNEENTIPLWKDGLRNMRVIDRAFGALDERIQQ